jgi:hypothetical protein
VLTLNLCRLGLNIHDEAIREMVLHVEIKDGNGSSDPGVETYNAPFNCRIGCVS